jgi:hypothetical protein
VPGGVGCTGGEGPGVSRAAGWSSPPVSGVLCQGQCCAAVLLEGVFLVGQVLWVGGKGQLVAFNITWCVLVCTAPAPSLPSFSVDDTAS